MDGTADAERGHLFIIDGDLTRVRADAVLIPTDAIFNVESIWNDLLVDGWDRRVERHDLGWEVCIDTGTSGSATQIWFANVGHVADEPGPYVDIAARFVTQAADTLRRRGSAAERGRPYLLALNVLGTGKGGMRDQRGLLIKDLVRRLSDLVVEQSIDVVLVTWGVKQYAAARRAQRLLRDTETSHPLPAILERNDVEEVIDALSRESMLQRLVLFVGAGVSVGAGLPDWKGLIAEMSEAAEPDIDAGRLESLDIRDQAQILMLSLGDIDFRNRIVASVKSPKYGLSHGLLASLDPHEVVTTNYDTLLEDAYGTARPPAVLPQSHVGPDGRWILKLHGTVTTPESIVLARQDYLGLPERSAALFGILQAMLMTKHMLFVGYSLTDDTFHRVMHDVRRAQGPTIRKVGTALTLFEDPLLERLWGDVLRFVPMAERPAEPTAADRQRTARMLEIVLDEVAIRSADVSAFLLDPTYDGVLDDSERAIRTEVLELLTATGTDEHIGASLRDMLRSLTRPDPKDSRP